MHHPFLTSGISELIHEQKHLAQFFSQPWDGNVLLIRLERDLVIAAERNLVDLAPHLEVVGPGNHTANTQDVLPRRRLKSSAHDVAAIPYGIDEWEWRFAGADVGASVSAIGLLSIWRQNLCSREFSDGIYFFGLVVVLPVVHVHSDLHDRRLGREFRVTFSKILHSLRLAVEMVDPRVLPFTLFFRITYSRKDEPIQTLHRGSRISDVFALLQFEIVAVLVDGLSGLQFRLGGGIVELGPEIRDGEDGMRALKGCYKRAFVVQVAFDDLGAFGNPCLGFGWVAGYAPDFPAGFFDVKVGDGAAL